jgi:hypothetical protein
MPFNNELKFLIEDAYRGKSFGELTSAPINAMAGINHEQARQLMAGLDVKTIGELANSRYVLWAQSITHLARFERIDAFNPSLSAILDEKWAMKRLRTIAKESPAVFTGLSAKAAGVLAETINVKTVEDLATNRFVMMAQVIAHLAKYEKIGELKKAA